MPVPPGGVVRFDFDLATTVSATTGVEHFGLVTPAGVWFGDDGEGGPRDDAISIGVVVGDEVPDPMAQEPSPLETDAVVPLGASSSPSVTGGCEAIRPAEFSPLVLIGLSVRWRRRGRAD